MALKKDKQKVLGEVFDDQRVKSFLKVHEQSDTDPDYIALERAYRGMNIENFATFVRFFSEENRNINAFNQDGRNMLQVVSEHRHSGNYAQLLKDAGAKY